MRSSDLLKICEWDNPISQNQKTTTDNKKSSSDYVIDWDDIEYVSLVYGSHIQIPARGDEGDILIKIYAKSNPKNSVSVMVQKAKDGHSVAIHSRGFQSWEATLNYLINELPDTCKKELGIVLNNQGPLGLGANQEQLRSFRVRLSVLGLKK